MSQLALFSPASPVEAPKVELRYLGDQFNGTWHVLVDGVTVGKGGRAGSAEAPRGCQDLAAELAESAAKAVAVRDGFREARS